MEEVTLYGHPAESRVTFGRGEPFYVLHASACLIIIPPFNIKIAKPLQHDIII